MQAARLHLPLSLRVFQSLLFLLVTEATFPIIQVYKIKEKLTRLPLFIIIMILLHL